jgi:hypothetical protein
MYYVMPKEDRTVADKDSDEPERPSIECLQSTKSAPPNLISQMSDFFYHHYIGQVRDLGCPLLARMRWNLYSLNYVPFQVVFYQVM